MNYKNVAAASLSIEPYHSTKLSVSVLHIYNIRYRCVTNGHTAAAHFCVFKLLVCTACVWNAIAYYIVVSSSLCRLLSILKITQMKFENIFQVHICHNKTANRIPEDQMKPTKKKKKCETIRKPFEFIYGMFNVGLSSVCVCVCERWFGMPIAPVRLLIYEFLFSGFTVMRSCP